MAPTREQLQANITAMEKQGAPQTDIQAYLDSFKGQQPVVENKISPLNGFGLLDSIISKGAQLTKNLPGAKLGEALGTQFAAGKEFLSGNRQGAKDILATAPTSEQVIGDTAKAMITPASLAVNPATALGKISVGAALGAGSAGAEAMTQGASAGDVAKQTAIGGAVGGAVSGAFVGLGKLINSVGEKIQQGVIKPNQHDLADGFDVKNIKKYKLGGSLSKMYDNTENKLATLSHELNRKLSDSTASVNLNDVIAETEKTLTGNKMKGFGANTSIQSALDQLKNEAVNVSQTGQLSVPDAQLVKQASGRFGAWQYGLNDPDSTARQTVYNAFYTKLKEAIEKNSPEGVKDINKKLSELIPIANAIIRRIPVADRNRVLSLQDMLTLTVGALDPRALAGFGISIAQKSGSVGNTLTKVGPAMQSIAPVAGTVGANVASELTNPAP